MRFAKHIVLSLLLLSILISLVSCLETKTPYDIAVENGYTGSVADWLEDLKGNDLDINDIYAAAVENGYTGDFLTFLSEFLSYNDNEIEDSLGSSPIGISKSMLASVSIVCNFSYRVESSLFPTTKNSTQSGSGVIYQLDRETGSAYIITNYHVVYYYNSTTANKISNDISVYLYGKESSQYAIPATYIGGSMQYDIAVLKITDNDILRQSDAVAVEVADSNLVTVGTTAIAIGNPEGAGISVTRGVVSVDSEDITMKASDNSTTVTHRLMRVDTAINSGNSGGGLFSESGKLIGIVNAKMSSNKVENIGYAIPSNVATYVAQNIIDTCDGETKTGVSKCMLGVTLSVTGSSAYYDAETGIARIRETVTVIDLLPSSLASGKIAKGDVITAIRIGESSYVIDRSFIVIDLMLTTRVGDEITVSVIRDGTPLEVSFTLTEASLTVVN